MSRPHSVTLREHRGAAILSALTAISIARLHQRKGPFALDALRALDAARTAREAGDYKLSIWLARESLGYSVGHKHSDHVKVTKLYRSAP